MKPLILFFCISFISPSLAKGNEVDSLLKVLDQVIIQKEKYNEGKRHKIDSLKISLIKINGLEDRYAVYQELFREFRHYNMDTALIIGYEKLLIAQDTKNTELERLSEMNIAETIGIMGMYKEALDIMNRIDRQKVMDKQLGQYYHVYHSTYILIAQNSLSRKEKEYYERLVSQYKDSILAINSPESLGYRLVNNGKLVEQGRYDEALTLMISCYLENEHSGNMMGSIAYGLSEIYEKLEDCNLQKKYLAISAISDLRKAVKGYIALRKLAILLYQKGDIDRAYAYIKCSMEDAIFCRARFRTLEISENLPVIVAAYDRKMKEKQDNLIKYILLSSFLSVALVVSIVFIYRQLKRLSTARKSISRMYNDLKTVNAEVKSMNGELSELNAKLYESNLVKETYIGSLFNLCSAYIDRMEIYRANVHRKLRSGEISEATNLTAPSSMFTEELKEFFRNFDAIFLSIYPNFVEQFNSLLKDGEQIVPKAGDILTPELRVFALIRLGINDNSKIASFFHYSPQTVYNYTLKIRNKLAISKEEFASAILKIGK